MTIAKNTKKAAKVLAGAFDVRCYSLSNCFTGNPIAEQPVVWRNGSLVHVTVPEFLTCELFSGIGNARLTTSGALFIVHVNSNLWYEFRSSEERPA